MPEIIEFFGAGAWITVVSYSHPVFHSILFLFSVVAFELFFLQINNIEEN